MRDYIVEDKAHKARARFLASIDPEKVVRLASSYHSNDPCTIFRPPAHGSYNVCFFVEFAEDRWVVRFPIPDRIPWVDEKLEAEIATMQYVAAKTTIPIPKIRAFSYTRDSPIQLAFIIMDYVQGKNLRELGFPKDMKVWFSVTTQPTKATRAVYEHLADLYTQLRSLEFPEIGALGFSADSSTIRARHRPLTIEVLLQQDEGLEPTVMFPKNKTFQTASEYVNALLWLADNLLDKGKNSFVDQRGARALYAIHGFRKFVTERWLDPALDRGPFVLMHGDLGIQNLLWDDDFNLVAVLDWEWASVVPVQFLVPPSWLNGDSVSFLTYSQAMYNNEVAKLNAIVRSKSQSLDWSRMAKWCHTLVVCALLRPEYIYDVFFSLIGPSIVGSQLRTPEQFRNYQEIVTGWVESFMDDEKKALLERKMREQLEYIASEEEYFGQTNTEEPG